jgi:branched-chain amino acid transport system substrate-binding protein
MTFDRRHLIGGLAGIAATAGAMTAVPAIAANEIVIGASLGRTGIYSTISKTTETSIDIAVREINAAGGINGHKIRLVKFDTAGDPKQAVVAVRKFARDDKALAVIGPFSSSEARVAFAAGEREKIVQIPNASSAPKLADKFSYAFRMTENEGLQFNRVLVTLKRKGMPIKSAAILYGTDDVVSKVVGLYIMKPLFAKNGIKLATAPIGFETKAVDLSAQVTQLKGLKVDYIGLAGITPVAVRVLKEMRRQGITAPIIGGQIWADPEIVRQMGKNGDGAVFSSWFWYKRDARTREFTRKFVEENKKRGIDKPFPHHVDASAYDTVYLLKQVMEEQKITGDPAKVVEERTKIRDGLKTVVFNGVIGKVCFESTGDAQLPGYVLTMKNSEWHLIDTHPSLPCKK